MADDMLIGLFADILGVTRDRLSDDTSPDNTPSWDSMRAMELVAALEETFDTQLSTGEIMRMRSIGIVRQVLRSKGVLPPPENAKTSSPG